MRRTRQQAGGAQIVGDDPELANVAQAARQLQCRGPDIQRDGETGPDQLRRRACDRDLGAAVATAACIERGLRRIEDLHLAVAHGHGAAMRALQRLALFQLGQVAPRGDLRHAGSLGHLAHRQEARGSQAASGCATGADQAGGRTAFLNVPEHAAGVLITFDPCATHRSPNTSSLRGFCEPIIMIEIDHSRSMGGSTAGTSRQGRDRDRWRDRDRPGDRAGARGRGRTGRHRRPRRRRRGARGGGDRPRCVRHRDRRAQARQRRAGVCRASSRGSAATRSCAPMPACRP